MTLRTFMVFFWVCLIGTAAVAGEEQRTVIKVAIDGDDTGNRVFQFDSQDSDVDLHELAVGESEVITDGDGNEVTIMRTEDGFEFDVEGEKIEIAGLQGEHDFAMLHEAHEDEDIVVEKHKQVRVIKTNDSHGVTIISGDELDDDTRAKLEKVLQEAGKDGEILFLDGSEPAHGKHEVRVIKKKIDVTN